MSSHVPPMTDPTPPQPDAAPQPPSPRAFCQATGLIYQIVGFIFCIGTCCWGFTASIGGFLGVGGDSLSAPVTTAPTATQPASTGGAHAAWFTAAVWSTFVGGLAAAAVGLAMQHERRKSGRNGMIVSGIMAAIFLGYLIFAIAIEPAVGRALGAAAMLALWIALFLLAGHSAELLRRFPPTTTDSEWTQFDEDAWRKSASHRRRDRTNL